MNDRYERGLRVLQSLGPERRARLVDTLSALAPELAAHVVEFAYGDIHARPGLDLKTRELVTVAALAAAGAPEDQLVSHLGAALELGWSAEQLTEALMQLSVCAGFPAAMTGLVALKRVLGETPEERTVP
jgi:4-carboxymuconolactone decarboxylase